MLLEGFERADQVVDGVRVATWTAGEGPPVLLLHGWPQDHHMWHEVAPGLARDHTVVLTDLRGYGVSDAPAAGERSAAYAKRAMAADQVGVMGALGHHRFAVVGHDRGGRVGHRMALDHPERVTRLAVVDIVPTRHVLEHADLALARRYFHWFLLGAPSPVPEAVLGADPVGWARTMLVDVLGGGLRHHPEALAAYLAAHERPEVLAATIADYRAALDVDLEHDRADGDRLVAAPLLVLWGAEGFVAERYDPLAVWRDHAERPDLVAGRAVPGGHFCPEHAPQETLAALRDFLAEAPQGPRPA